MSIKQILHHFKLLFATLALFAGLIFAFYILNMNVAKAAVLGEVELVANNGSNSVNGGNGGGGGQGGIAGGWLSCGKNKTCEKPWNDVNTAGYGKAGYGQGVNTAANIYKNTDLDNQQNYRDASYSGGNGGDNHEKNRSRKMCQLDNRDGNNDPAGKGGAGGNGGSSNSSGQGGGFGNAHTDCPDDVAYGGGGGGGGAGGKKGANGVNGTNLSSLIYSLDIPYTRIVAKAGNGGGGGIGGNPGSGASQNARGAMLNGYQASVNGGNSCSDVVAHPGAGGGGGGGGNAGNSGSGGSSTITFSSAETKVNGSLQVIAGSDGTGNISASGSGQGGAGSSELSGRNCLSGHNGAAGKQGRNVPRGAGGNATIDAKNKTVIVDNGAHVWEITQKSSVSSVVNGTASLTIGMLKIMNNAQVTLNVKCELASKCSIQIDTLQLEDGGKFFVNISGGDINTKVTINANNIYMDATSEVNFGTSNAYDNNNIFTNKTTVKTSSKIKNPLVYSSNPQNAKRYNPGDMLRNGRVNSSAVGNNIQVKFSRSMRKALSDGDITLKVANETTPSDIATFKYNTMSGVDVKNGANPPDQNTEKAFFMNDTLVIPLDLFRCTDGCTFMGISANANPLTLVGHLPYQHKVEVLVPSGLFETNIDIADAARVVTGNFGFYFYTSPPSISSVKVNVAGSPEIRQINAEVGEEVSFDAKIATNGPAWPSVKPSNPFSSIKWELYGVKNQMTTMPQFVNYENIKLGGELYGDLDRYNIAQSSVPEDCGPPVKNASNIPEGSWYGCIDSNTETVRNTIKISQAETSSAIFVVAKSTYDNAIFGFGVITVGGRVKTNVDIIPNTYDLARGMPDPFETDPEDPENGQSVIEATIEIAKNADNTIVWELGGNTDARSGIYKTSGRQDLASRTLETSAGDLDNCAPADGKPVEESTTFKCKIYVYAGDTERSPILTLRAYSRFSSSAQDFLMINVLDVGVLALAVTPPMVTITAGTEQMFDVSAMEGLGYQELTPDQYDNLNVYWEVLTPTDPATQVREITDEVGRRHAILKVGREEMSPQLILIARNRINNDLYGYSTITVEQTLSGVVHIEQQDLVLARSATENLSARVQLPAAFDASLYWQVVGNVDAETKILTPTTPHASPNTQIHIGANEPAGGAVLVVAQAISDPSISGYAIIRIEQASEPGIALNPSVATIRVDDDLLSRTQVFSSTIINSATDTKGVVYELIGASAGTTLEPASGAVLLQAGETIAEACTRLGVQIAPGNATFVLGQSESNQAVYVRTTMCSHQGKSDVAEIRVRGYKLQSLAMSAVVGDPTYVTYIDPSTVQLEQNAPNSQIVKFNATLDLPSDFASAGIANNEYIDWSVTGGSSDTAFCTAADTPRPPCIAPNNVLVAQDPARPSVFNQLSSSMVLSVDPNESASTLLIKACSKFNAKLCQFASVKLVNKSSTGLKLTPRSSAVNVSTGNELDRKVEYHAILTVPSTLPANTIASAGVSWNLTGQTSPNTHLENATGASCDQDSGARVQLAPCYLIVDEFETSSMLVVKAISKYSEQLVDFAEVMVQSITTSGLAIKKFGDVEVANTNRESLSHSVGACVPVEVFNYSSIYRNSDVRFKVNGVTQSTSFYANQADCESQSDIVNLGQTADIATVSATEYMKATSWLYISENENNPSFTLTACLVDNESICDLALISITGATNSGVSITPAQKDVITGEIVDLEALIYQPPGAERFIFWDLQGSDGGSRLIDKDYYDSTGGDFRPCSPKSFTDAAGMGAFESGHDFTKCALYVSPDETSYLLLVTARLNYDAQQRFTSVFNVTNHIASAVYFAPMYLRAVPDNDYTFFGQMSLPVVDTDGLSPDEASALILAQNEKRKAILWTLSGQARDSYIYTIVKNEFSEEAIQLGCEDTTTCYLHVAHDEPNGTLMLRAQSKLNGSRSSIGTIDVRNSSTSGVRACSQNDIDRSVSEMIMLGETTDTVNYNEIWNTCEHINKADAGSTLNISTNVTISRQEFLEDSSTSAFSNWDQFGTRITCEVYGGVRGTNVHEVVEEDLDTGEKSSTCELSISQYEIASELSLIVRSQIDPMQTDRFTILVTKRAMNGVEIAPKVDVKLLPGQEQSFTAIVRDLACKARDDYFYDSDLSVDDFTDYQESANGSLGAVCGQDEVTWSIKGQTQGTEIMQNGVLKVSSNEAARYITVLATSKYDHSRVDAVVVEIVNHNTAGVRIFPDVTDVGVGKGQAFAHETFLPFETSADASPQDTSVTWSVNGGIHSTTIDANNGFLAVSPSETASNLLVMARSNYDQTLIGYAMVNVTDIVEPSVKILTEEKNLEYGEVLALESEVVVPEDQDDSTTWKIYGNTSPATFISSDGVLTIAGDEESKAVVVNLTSNWNQQLQDTKTFSVNKDVYTTFDFESSVHAMSSILDANSALEAGAVPTFVKNSNSDLKFATGYTYEESKGILVNGKPISDDDYSLLEVSGDYLMQHPQTLETTANGKSFQKDLSAFNHYTLITLKANYLESLELGDHALKLDVKGVDANAAPFRVVDVNFSSPAKLILAPKNYVLLLVFLVMLLCAGGLAALHSRGVLTRIKEERFGKGRDPKDGRQKIGRG